MLSEVEIYELTQTLKRTTKHVMVSFFLGMAFGFVIFLMLLLIADTYEVIDHSNPDGYTISKFKNGVSITCLRQ